MTNNYLKSLIVKLNNNRTNGLIFLRPLTATVDFGKVWSDQLKPTDEIASPDGPYNFYFIKNNEGTYVAIVLDMCRDLHWFVLSGYRRQGHLTKALKETILYHLFQDRDEQRITVDIHAIGRKNFSASEKVALSLGFNKTLDDDNSEYILSKDKYQTASFTLGQNTEISEERMEEIKKQINYISRSLWLVQTEIEMKLGASSYTRELIELKDKIRKHTWRFEDTWFESRNTFNN